MKFTSVLFLCNSLSFACLIGREPKVTWLWLTVPHYVFHYLPSIFQDQGYISDMDIDSPTQGAGYFLLIWIKIVTKRWLFLIFEPILRGGFLGKMLDLLQVPLEDSQHKFKIVGMNSGSFR